MKTKYVIVLLFCFISTTLLAQKRDFNGYWEGKVKQLDSDEEFAVRLNIIDNNVYVVDSNYEYVNLPISVSKGYGEQLNFFWMNKGEVWTETQMYSLSFINSETLSVHFMRHVSNIKSALETSDWGYTALGRLKKVPL